VTGDDTTEDLMVELARLAFESKVAEDRRKRQAEQIRRRVVEAVSGSDPGVRWFVLFCRRCDPDLETPMPFLSAADRGRWAGAHTRETSHDRWLVIEHDVEGSPS
jgi:hypothetical protein